MKQKKKRRLLPIILGTLASSVSGNMLAGKRVVRADERVIRAGEDFNDDC